MAHSATARRQLVSTIRRFLSSGGRRSPELEALALLGIARIEDADDRPLDARPTIESALNIVESLRTKASAPNCDHPTSNRPGTITSSVSASSSDCISFTPMTDMIARPCKRLRGREREACSNVWRKPVWKYEAEPIRRSSSANASCGGY